MLFATNHTDTLCTILHFNPSHRCEDGWWCYYLGEMLRPSSVRCSAGEVASDWVQRQWRCESDRAYLGQLQLQCKEQLCPVIEDCVVTYDLVSVVYAIVACLLFLCAVAIVMMTVYYVTEMKPMHIKMPYVQWSNGRPHVYFMSIEDLRARDAHSHLL